MAKTFLTLAALSGMLAVGLGAFGAHSLETLLNARSLATYHTAVEYHMTHSLALFGVSILLLRFPDNRSLKLSGVMFGAGIILFSGSLYLLGLTGISWLGAITPIGGFGFLIGWGSLTSFAWTLDSTSAPSAP